MPSSGPQRASKVQAAEVAPLQEISLRLVRRLRRRLGVELTMSQMSALTTLERAGTLRVGELARREQISKSSVTRLVSKLESMGYVTRAVDPEDARSFLVTIGADALALLTAARQRANEYLAHEVERLDVDDRAALLGAIAAFERLVALPKELPGTPTPGHPTD